jgi:hypothetical protein
MPDPFPFPSTTPNIGLPLLATGQAQKEFFVNHALSILDALDRRTVIASLAAPPANANEGDCYRVTATATQQWVGEEDHIAIFVAGAWYFVAPKEGMRVFDSTADRMLFFQGGWQFAAVPEAPTGGAVIDAEARIAINQLVQSLRGIGLFGPVGS